MAETKTVSSAIVPKRGIFGNLYRGVNGFATAFGEVGDAAADLSVGAHQLGNLLVVEQTSKLLERAGISHEEFKSMCAT